MTLVPMVNDGRPVPVVSSLPSAATVSKIGNDVDRQHSSLLSPPLPVLTLFIGMLIEDDMMTTLPSIHPHTIRTVNQKPSSLKWTQQKTTNRRISCKKVEIGTSLSLWHDVTRPEKVRRLNVTCQAHGSYRASLFGPHQHFTAMALLFLSLYTALFLI